MKCEKNESILKRVTKRLKKDFIDLLHSPKDLIIICIPLLILILSIIPVPYYITVGGGTINISERIVIDNEYKESGSLNSAYVKELRGNVVTYLLSYVIPSFTATKVSDVVLDDETKEDYAFREKLELTISNNNAVKVAYEALNKKIEVEDVNLYVAYLDKESITDLKVKDIILKLEDEKITDRVSLNKALEKYKYKDEINITVLRDNKEVICKAKLINMDNEKKIGVYAIEEIKYKTDEEIKFNFKDNESGPSGGLMMTLSIYNKLIEKDITKGKKIVGTGTIDENGNVGEIGGVKYKLMGAVHDKADIFLVPIDNYQEAKELKDEKNYKIDIVPVETFNDALEALDNLTDY